MARNLQQDSHQQADDAGGDVRRAHPERNGWTVQGQRNRKQEARKAGDDDRQRDAPRIEAMVADIPGGADLGKERIDHDLNEPDLAKHPEYEPGPKQEKKIWCFHLGAFVAPRGERVAVLNKT